ncbi:DHA2 family efflux MFS transporter permease subunit [Paenibacillus glufosinatiresistens]|uniref:DHA2 family efflux MFS transporter permease subunit n=1 Tax=Paenibacillus glufosinatiresistens TaxID=3070657 RepID=UPI00286DA674|nr:DHA2 family efflux MFS transporter permease subunit [Paenibacillus sp. YX.27]
MNQRIQSGPVMAALLVAGFVGLFSETALNIALGDLGHIFEVNATVIQWLATAYFLTLGILVPVTGILMQKLTTRQMFITAVVLMLGGTVLAALAPVFPVLLAGRVIQAAGLAINLPLTQNVIFTIFPPAKRGAAMGIMGLVMLAGPALGPTIAGLILDTLSWNWIFWVTVPFLLFSLVFGLKYVPNLHEVREVRVDALSIVLSTLGFGGLVYGVSIAGEKGWGGAGVVLALILGILGLLLFTVRQLKMKTPMLNLKAFQYPMFVVGVVMGFITFFNMLSMLVILPLYMQGTLLVAAFTTGLVLLPGSLLNCVLAPVIGRLFDKYGPKAVVTPGTLFVAAAYAIYAQFGADTALWLVVVAHIVMMIGVGAVLANVQTNTLNSLPRAYYPDGIALTQTVQQVAGAIGIAVMVSVFSARSGELSGAPGGIAEATAAGSSRVFLIGLILAAVNVGLSLLMKKPGEVRVKAGKTESAVWKEEEAL